MMEPYYEDDRCALYRGDALAVLAAMPNGCVDAVLADPPYSSGGMFRADRAQSTGVKYRDGDALQEIPDFSGDSRDSRAYGYWTALWLGEALRVVRPGGIAAVFTDWRQLPTTSDGIQAGGWVWRGVVPWHKPAGRPTQGRWGNQCEYIVWGTNGARSLDELEGKALPGFYQANAPRVREHMTQKPVEVMRDLVKIVPVDGYVLDPFMGAGTTGVACMIEGRRFIGVEQAPHFAEVAQRRIREAQGQAIPRGNQDALDFGAVS